MAAFNADKIAFFFRNRCTQDGVYGNADASANVSHGNTLNNIYHKSLLRAAQLEGNDATVTIQLRDKYRDVQAIHIVADLTPMATITIQSKNTSGSSYATRKTLDLGTEAASAGAFLTGGAVGPEDRKDPLMGLYSVYFNASEQSTVDGHAWWTIQLQDPGQSATGSLFLRKVFLGPGLQFLTLPADGNATSFQKTFRQAAGQRVYGAMHSNSLEPNLMQVSMRTNLRTTSEIADLEYDLSRIGTQKPFFFALTPDQGTITDATNYAEKWSTLYGAFAGDPTLERVPGAVTLTRFSGTMLEAR